MYVYVVRAKVPRQDPIYKIGRASDPQRRLSELQVGSPLKLVLIGTIRCQSQRHSAQIERAMHARYRHQLRHGEWFRLSNPQRNEIASIIRKATEHANSEDAAKFLHETLDAEFESVVGKPVKYCQR